MDTLVFCTAAYAIIKVKVRDNGILIQLLFDWNVYISRNILSILARL
jgi:hypothetical protein